MVSCSSKWPSLQQQGSSLSEDRNLPLLKKILSHPSTRDLDLDDPRLLQYRRSIIREKAFLRQIYNEWYRLILSIVEPRAGLVLEVGSGAGFLQDVYSPLITSDIIRVSGISTVLDAHRLPFAKDLFSAIVMCNVLHHLPNVREFFREAGRCTKRDGYLILIEPWVSKWSSLIYTHFHHEPFDPRTKDWTFQGVGHLSSANGALPWIVFERDRELFKHEFPEWRIVRVRPFMAFLYLLSGGVSGRALMPGWSYSFWRAVESLLEPWANQLAMFSFIVLSRK